MKYLLPVLLLLCISCGSRKGQNGSEDSTRLDSQARSESPMPDAVNGTIEVIFGKFCGHCIGNCTQMYLLSDQLSADTSNAFRQGPEAMHFNVKMSQAAYNKASKLLSMIPEELYELHDTTYGCPDCADQCGFYLEIHKGGKKGRYRIDTQHYNLPAWLKDFPGKMGALISDLN